MGVGGGGDSSEARPCSTASCECGFGAKVRAGRRSSLLSPGTGRSLEGSGPGGDREANSFRMIYPPDPRWATVMRTAESRKLFDRFLNFRSSSRADVQSAKDLTTKLLEEFAVWLVGKQKVKQTTAVLAFSRSANFIPMSVHRSSLHQENCLWEPTMIAKSRERSHSSISTKSWLRPKARYDESARPTSQEMYRPARGTSYRSW